MRRTIWAQSKVNTDKTRRWDKQKSTPKIWSLETKNILKQDKPTHVIRQFNLTHVTDTSK